MNTPHPCKRCSLLTHAIAVLTVVCANVGAVADDYFEKDPPADRNRQARGNTQVVSLFSQDREGTARYEAANGETAGIAFLDPGFSEMMVQPDGSTLIWNFDR